MDFWKALIFVGLRWRFSLQWRLFIPAFAPFPVYSLVIFSHKANLPLLLYQWIWIIVKLSFFRQLIEINGETNLLGCIFLLHLFKMWIFMHFWGIIWEILYIRAVSLNREHILAFINREQFGKFFDKCSNNKAFSWLFICIYGNTLHIRAVICL